MPLTPEEIEAEIRIDDDANVVVESVSNAREQLQQLYSRLSTLTSGSAGTDGISSWISA